MMGPLVDSTRKQGGLGKLSNTFPGICCTKRCWYFTPLATHLDSLYQKICHTVFLMASSEPNALLRGYSCGQWICTERPVRCSELDQFEQNDTLLVTLPENSCLRVLESVEICELQFLVLFRGLADL